MVHGLRKSLVWMEPLTPISLEKQEAEECKQTGEHVEDATLLHHIAIREEVAQRQEDEAD